jgi:putative ABC transport system permease protein
MKDLRHGFRSLLNTPIWTFTVAATLALGIGLTTAIFSIVYGVLLRRLPYPEPSRLVALWSSAVDGSMARFNVSPANWRDWRTELRSFEEIALTRPIANFNLTGSGQPERLQGARSSWNLTDVLAVRPLRGRWYSEAETLADAKVAVLSNRLWQRRFGADDNIVGRKVQLNGEWFDVIGVMPDSFGYPTRDFELWTPLFISEETFRSRVDFSYWSVARLKPGVTTGQAQAEIATVMNRLAQAYLNNRNVTAIVENLQSSDAADVKHTLYVGIKALPGVTAVGVVPARVLTMIGFALTWPAGRAIQSLLFRVDATDTLAALSTGAALVAVAVLAACGPAHRAATADPAVVLRTD